MKFLKRFKQNLKNVYSYYSLITKVKLNQSIYGFDCRYTNQEEKLYKMFGKCESFTKQLKLIVISDTHNCLKKEEFEQFVAAHSDYDACFLLGDHHVNDIEIILKYIDKKRIFGLLGNHDFNYIKEYEIHDLNGQLIEINGVKLLGIQGSFKYKPADFPSFTQKESIEFLNSKDKADVLISHDNRFNSAMVENPAHQGLFGITYYLYKNKVPYHIHGHLHNSYKKVLRNGTQEISTYMYEYIILN